MNPIKLKAAAEHLEWVLRQYPDNDDVQAMLRELTPLIEAAKLGKLGHAMETQRVPFNWAVNSEGLYDDHRSPSVRSAYVDFQIELAGGVPDRANASVLESQP